MIHEVFVNNKLHSVKVLEKNGNVFLIEVGSKTVKVKLNLIQGKTLTIEINGEVFQADVERTQRGSLKIKSSGKVFEVQCLPKILKETVEKLESPLLATKKPAARLPSENGAVVAPIAGRIVLLNASLGEKVERGTCICILEAMKMENEVVAPKTGVVNEIRVSKGAIVNKGDVLAVIG
ncbi:acetyl-CoA carboxylase biotin carboxyl carrier protein subunit [Candidatus Bathyarchaeota archaeon]|nr:acetyl-CoA carboxylase biotin carboxyl carrier protein subunit [Candidatus Bathyarchaeota archaeon]